MVYVYDIFPDEAYILILMVSKSLFFSKANCIVKTMFLSIIYLWCYKHAFDFDILCSSYWSSKSSSEFVLLSILFIFFIKFVFTMSVNLNIIQCEFIWVYIYAFFSWCLVWDFFYVRSWTLLFNDYTFIRQVIKC